jgi:hypothetical protein
MVEKLINLIARIKSEKGPIALFALWKDVPDVDKWTIIISALWIDSMSDLSALNYWVGQISNTLTASEANVISRISFLRTNSELVNLFTNSINVIESDIILKDTYIGSVYIQEAIILESQKPLPVSSGVSIRSRNPIFNRTINPVFNRTINPIFNRNINPIFNRSINPIFNRTINPVFNRTINPIFNRSYEGPYIYNNNARRSGYIVRANIEVILLYSQNNDLQGIGVINPIQGYTVFNNSNNWIGTLIPNGAGGFNYYTDGNEWIGFVV